jgi:hypothetical protein
MMIDLVLGAFIALIAWLARELWVASRDLKHNLSTLREELPRQYVLKDDLDRAVDRIDAKLDKIFDKLDGKADKRCSDC